MPEPGARTAGWLNGLSRAPAVGLSFAATSLWGALEADMKRWLGMVAVAAAVSTAACGGGGQTVLKIEATPAALAQVADRTLSAGTVRVDLTMDMRVSGKTIHSTMSGVEDIRRQAMKLTIQMSGSSALSGLGGDLQLVLLDGVMYMQIPAMKDQVGKSWVKADLESTTPGMAKMLSSFKGQDPSSQFAVLYGATAPREVGKETIHGVGTTHFRGSFRYDELLPRLPERLRAGMEAVMANLPDSFKTTTVPFDVWVGDDGRIYRLEEDVTATLPRTGAFSMKVHMDLHDYGVDVSIEAPPADDTVDFAELSSMASDSTSTMSSAGSAIN